jgi:hypothetical protein
MKYKDPIHKQGKKQPGETETRWGNKLHRSLLISSERKWTYDRKTG